MAGAIVVLSVGREAGPAWSRTRHSAPQPGQRRGFMMGAASRIQDHPALQRELFFISTFSCFFKRAARFFLTPLVSPGGSRVVKVEGRFAKTFKGCESHRNKVIPE